MSKFYGAIGYSVTEEIRPGVWGEKITVRDYYGDVIRNTRQYQSSDNLNDNLNVSNEFSIVADPFAYANFHSMRFIEYMGFRYFKRCFPADTQRGVRYCYCGSS